MLHDFFKSAKRGELPTNHESQLVALRTLTGLLLGLCILIILYETAIPFRLNLTHSGLQHRWNRSEWVPFLDNDGSWLSIADAIGNVLLFVPFGFFLHHWRWVRRAADSDVRSIRVSVLAGLLYSCIIEIFQLGLDRRTTSINDVMTNSLGTYLGVRLALARPELIGATWKRIRHMTRARPGLVVWLAIMLTQTVIALPPFDFTLQQESLQRQWLRWQYSWRTLSSLSSFSESWGKFIKIFPHHEYLAVALIAAAGLGILLGAAGTFCCQQYGNTSPRIFWGVALTTFFYYPALTALQFMVQSIRPVVLFPLTGVASVTLGALFMFTFLCLTPILRPRQAN